MEAAAGLAQTPQAEKVVVHYTVQAVAAVAQKKAQLIIALLVLVATGVLTPLALVPLVVLLTKMVLLEQVEILDVVAAAVAGQGMV